MITYLLIGVLFMFAIEVFYQWLEKKYNFKDTLKISDRVIGIFIWPIGLIFFVWGFITTYFKK
jgi:hypothetical protein